MALRDKVTWTIKSPGSYVTAPSLSTSLQLLIEFSPLFVIPDFFTSGKKFDHFRPWVDQINSIENIPCAKNQVWPNSGFVDSTEPKFWSKTGKGDALPLIYRIRDPEICATEAKEVLLSCPLDPIEPLVKYWGTDGWLSLGKTMLELCSWSIELRPEICIMCHSG